MQAKIRNPTCNKDDWTWSVNLYTLVFCFLFLLVLHKVFLSGSIFFFCGPFVRLTWFFFYLTCLIKRWVVQIHFYVDHIISFLFGWFVTYPHSCTFLVHVTCLILLICLTCSCSSCEEQNKDGTYMMKDLGPLQVPLVELSARRTEGDPFPPKKTHKRHRLYRME